MKIQQEHVYIPITISLETKEEADLFFSIVDKIDADRNNNNEDKFAITAKEYKIIFSLSEFRTDTVGLRD